MLELSEQATVAVPLTPVAAVSVMTLVLPVVAPEVKESELGEAASERFGLTVTATQLVPAVVQLPV